MRGLTEDQQALLERLAARNGVTPEQMADRLVAAEVVRLATLDNKVVPWPKPTQGGDDGKLS